MGHLGDLNFVHCVPMVVLKIPICLSSDVLYFSAFKDDVDAVWVGGGGARWPEEKCCYCFYTNSYLCIFNYLCIIMCECPAWYFYLLSL